MVRVPIISNQKKKNYHDHFPKKFLLFSAVFVFAVYIFVLTSSENIFVDAQESSSTMVVGSHSVGVTLSKTCLTLISIDGPITCPTYEDLLQLDNSNHQWSGEFAVNEDTGIFERHEPKLTNSWRLYDHTDDWLIIVDPPRGMHERIKLITIESNFDTYTDKADQTVVNYTRVIYHDRFVDGGCHSATINADKWKILLADTIHYMRQGCLSEHTSYNHTEYIPIQLTKHDISTSQKWKHQELLDYVSEHCIFKFKSCDKLN